MKNKRENLAALLLLNGKGVNGQFCIPEGIAEAALAILNEDLQQVRDIEANTWTVHAK